MSFLTFNNTKREFFDPKNPTHLTSLKQYLKTGAWGQVQFHAELPYIEVPMTVLMKYATHNLKVIPETSVNRTTRLTNSKIIPWTSA